MSDIEGWNPHFIDNEHLVSVKLYVVPLYTWNSKFFKLVGGVFGDFMYVDESTSSIVCLDVTHVLIKVKGEV